MDVTIQQPTQLEPQESQGSTQNTFDVNKYVNEYQSNGKLSEESYKEISRNKGLSTEEIDTFIYGYKAKAEAEAKHIVDQVYSTIEGGQQRYDEMLSWAKDSYSKEDAEAFDKAISSGDVNAIKREVKLLEAMYTKANNSQSNRRVVPSSMLMRSAGSNQSGGARFSDFTEMREAMKDPRWNSDSKYTMELTAKAARGFINENR